MPTPSQSTSEPLAPGDELPPIVLSDDTGALVDLREVAATNTVILFFYPRDNGIRCRTQACSMRDSWPLLRAEGIEVFGVNHMDAASHHRFREKHGLPFRLLVDDELELSKAFGFVNLWGPPGVSPIERSTAIIDPGGTVRAVLRRVRPSTHFDLLRADLGLPERA